MPSHIELNKNLTFPAASATDKLIFGVTTTNHAVLVDSEGHVIDLGGTGSIIPPLPYNSYVAKLSENHPTYLYSDVLLVGETYKITDYQLGDDFSNVANIISGNINSHGCVFVATGTTPNSWGNGTELESYGLPRIDAELDNTIGLTPDWNYLGAGTYAFNFSESVNYNKVVPYISPTSPQTLGSSIEVNLQDGSYSFLDRSFNRGDGFEYGSGFDGDVYTIVRQADGKIIVGGNFTTYQGGSANYIIRLNADGTLDRGFNIGSGFNGPVYALATQSDGKIIVVGDISTYNGSGIPYGICRLNADGTLDTTFNYSGGFGGGFNDVVRAVTIQADGKILVGGYFLQYTDVTNGTTSMNAVIRLNTDGTYDTTFNNGGSGFYYIGGSVVYSLAIQPDGKILAGGFFVEYNESATSTDSLCIARLNTNGTFDASFANGVDVGFDQEVYTIAIQSDGKIICGGLFSNHSDNGMSFDSFGYIARLNTNGTSDTSFASYNAGFNGDVFSIIVYPNNQILVGGTFNDYSGNGIGYIADLDIDGNYIGNVSSFDSVVYALYLQSDSKVIVGGGFVDYVGTGANYIIRLTGRYNIDTVTDFGNGFNKAIFASAIQPDGKIIVGGDLGYYNDYYTTRYGITRLNTDGKEDLTFNNYTGSSTAGFTGNGERVYSLSLQSDGSIICGGDWKFYNGTSYALNLAKLDATGSLDTAFDSNLGAGFDDAIFATAIQSDGKIIVGGQFSQLDGNTVPYGICRLNSNGILDTTFNYDGGFGDGFNDRVRAIKIQDDGKILIGGQFSQYNDVTNGTTYMTGFIRLNTDGTYDTTFNNGGTGFATDKSPGYGPVYEIGIQSDGKIICGGVFQYYTDITDTYSSNYIARLNTDGTFDTTFSSYNYGFDNPVYSLIVQSGDNIVCGGDFTDYNGTTLRYLVRLDKDGNILNNFYDYGGGLDDSVYSVSSTPNNKLIVGGYFGDYEGSGIGDYIARLYAGYDVTLLSANPGFAPSDDLLNKTPIEIRLYN